MLEIIANVNILANAPYSAFYNHSQHHIANFNRTQWVSQFAGRTGHCYQLPSGTEFPIGNYSQQKKSSPGHPRYAAPHTSCTHQSWGSLVKSKAARTRAFTLSIIKLGKITLKKFLQSSLTPKLTPFCSEKRVSSVTGYFPSLHAVTDELLNTRKLRCCRWLAWKIYCTQIP